MPLKGLSDEQLDAVKYEGNLLLTACPGAGKTKTLVSKIAYQLNHEDCIGKKERLIAITYTNVAAVTILERLDIYGIDSKNLWVGTIHSFCLEWIIKPYVGYSSRISRGFRIIDEYEQRKLIDIVKAKYNIGFFDDLPIKLNDKFEICATRNTALYNAANEYHRILYDNQWIDFDLILTISLSLLNENIEIGRRLASLFFSILVDEFQDTNQEQYDVLASILSHKKTVATFIGDVDQAIYTGLGAVVKNREQIERELGLSVVAEKSLSGCYRSTQLIINFYSLFQDNDIEIKSLCPLPIEKSDVFFESNVHRDNLGEYVGGIIEQKLIEGVKPSEIVVIAPQWTDVIRLGGLLKQAYPHLEFNAPGISPIPKSQDNPWIHLVRLYFIPISARSYSKRRRIASLLIEELESMQFSFNSVNNPIKLTLTKINQLSPNSSSTVEVFLESLITEFVRYIDLGSEINSLLNDAKISLIESSTLRIKQFKLLNDASTLSAYFRESNGVNVTSCHSTKGEEYDVVIATGLLKGKLPHWNDIIDRSQKYENYMARRLLYVISSRARKYLYLVSERGHTTRAGNALVTTPQLTSVLD